MPADFVESGEEFSVNNDVTVVAATSPSGNVFLGPRALEPPVRIPHGVLGLDDRDGWRSGVTDRILYS